MYVLSFVGQDMYYTLWESAWKLRGKQIFSKSNNSNSGDLE